MSLDDNTPRSSNTPRPRATAQPGVSHTARAPRSQSARMASEAPTQRGVGVPQNAAPARREAADETQHYARSSHLSEEPTTASVASSRTATSRRPANTSRTATSNTGRTQRVVESAGSPARNAARAKAAARQQQNYVQNQWTSMKAPVAQSAENRAQNKRRSARGIQRFLPRAAAIVFVATVLSLGISAYLGYWSFADVGNGIATTLGFAPKPETEDPTPGKQPDELVDTMGGLAGKPTSQTNAPEGGEEGGEGEEPKPAGETIEETGTIYPRSLTLGDIKSELHDSDGLWYVVGSFSYQFLKSGEAVEHAVFTTTCPEAQLSTDRGEPAAEITFDMEPAFGKIVVTALMPIGSYDNMTLLSDALTGYTIDGTIKLKNGNTIHRVLTFESGTDPNAVVQNNTGATGGYAQGYTVDQGYTDNSGYTNDGLPQTDPNAVPSNQPQSSIAGF